MKIKSIIALLVGFISYLSIHYFVNGYGNMMAHPSLNSAFVDYLEKLLKGEPTSEIQFEFSDKSYNRLSGPGVTNYGFFASTTGESNMSLSPKGWLMHGGLSADEPEVPAAVRHFYDPLAQKNGAYYLTNRGTYWEGLYGNPHINAIDWAFGTGNGSENQWSFAKGKEYFAKSIEEADQTKKNEYMAKAWRCLGETLHNTADMACPPHVRNDSHAAPFGWSGGWAFGSPDPYEEFLVDSTWVKDCLTGEPDPNFKSAIEDLESAREVNVELAKFTNSNFFSHQTISGKGVSTYTSANGEKDYPSPKLENLVYVPEEFTFYKTFPSGRSVKMCKDHSYFRFRGSPYVDYDCAKSQAKELVPNFKFAALKVFALFLPEILVNIDEIDSDGNLIGSVVHGTSKEYTKELNYNGKVALWVGSTLTQLVATNGEFKTKINIADLNAGKAIKAVVDLGGVIIRSPEFKSSNWSKYKKFQMATTFEAFDEEGVARNFDLDFTLKTADPAITWNGSKFIYTKTAKNFSVESTQTLEATFSNSDNYAEKIKYTATTNDKSTVEGFELYDKTDYILEFKSTNSFDLYFNTTTSLINLSNTEIKKLLTNFSIINVKTVPKYDNNGKIISVSTKTTKWTSINHSNVWNTFAIMMW